MRLLQLHNYFDDGNRIEEQLEQLELLIVYVWYKLFQENFVKLYINVMNWAQYGVYSYSIKTNHLSKTKCQVQDTW